jgi:hypothetical protein
VNGQGPYFFENKSTGLAKSDSNLKTGELPCEKNFSTKNTAFERSSKRRKGYPSETKVKRGTQVIHGEKDLMEKLGRNDLCPCGSGRRFQALLSA